MTEAEGKLFRQLHTVALDRYCERVLAEVGILIADSGKTNHERYLALFKLIKERDQDLAAAFNDLRRSTALRQLAVIRSLELLTEEEFGRFRQETRDSVAVWLGQ